MKKFFLMFMMATCAFAQKDDTLFVPSYFFKYNPLTSGRDTRFVKSDMIYFITGGVDTLWSVINFTNESKLKDVAIYSAKYDTKSTHIWKLRLFSISDSAMKRQKIDTLNVLRDTFHRARGQIISYAVFKTGQVKSGIVERMKAQRFEFGNDVKLDGLCGVMLTRDSFATDDSQTPSAFRAIEFIIASNEKKR